MIDKAPFLTQAFTALEAFVRSFSFVGSLVRYKTRTATEVLPTIWALVRFLAGVDPPVRFQV